MKLSRDVLVGLEERLAAHAGLDLPRWVLEARAAARAAALGLDGPRYLALISAPGGGAELTKLVEAVRVGETRFFRHQAQFDTVSRVVVPAWRARGIWRPRVLSAGCASGEEAYSLAAAITQSDADGGTPLRPSVLGVDVSHDALERARRGRYPAAAASHVPASFRDAFVSDGETLRPTPELVSLVRFAQKNLAATDALGRFDLIFCRNVLIYFEEDAKRDVLARLVAALEPGGYLFLGYSETLRDVAGLAQEGTGERAVWVKASPPAAPSSSASARRSSPELSPFVPAPALAVAPKLQPALARVRVIDAATEVARVATAIREAMETGGLSSITVNLDAVDELPDALAPVLRRARTAATALGIELSLRTTRERAKRFVRRHGLSEGDP